jgi:hypothetical protein
MECGKVGTLDSLVMYLSVAILNLFYDIRSRGDRNFLFCFFSQATASSPRIVGRGG